MPVPLEEIERQYGPLKWESPRATAVYGWGDRIEAAFNGLFADVLRLFEQAGLDVADTRRVVQYKSDKIRENTSISLGVPESFSAVSDLGDVGTLVIARVVDTTPYLLVGVLVALLVRWVIRRSRAKPAN